MGKLKIIKIIIITIRKGPTGSEDNYRLDFVLQTFSRRTHHFLLFTCSRQAPHPSDITSDRPIRCCSAPQTPSRWTRLHFASCLSSDRQLVSFLNKVTSWKHSQTLDLSGGGETLLRISTRVLYSSIFCYLINLCCTTFIWRIIFRSRFNVWSV